jgi:hypothetical protein
VKASVTGKQVSRSEEDPNPILVLQKRVKFLFLT